MHDQAFTWTYVLTAIGYVSRSGMSGSFCRCNLIDVRYCQTVLQTGYTILHSHQQCIKCSIWVHLLPTLHIFILLHFGHSKRFVVKVFCFNWHFPSNLSCWASFSCSFAIRESNFFVYSKILTILFLGKKKWLHLLLLEFWDYLYIMCKSPLSYMWLANTFSQSIGCLKFADCLNFEQNQFVNFFSVKAMLL